MAIRKVLIIGNGTMSQHIGLQCALFGTDVTMYVRNPGKNAGTVSGAEKAALSLLEEGRISRERLEGAMKRICVSNDVEDACAGADLVSESVAENVEIKRETWKKFAPWLPGNAILTTNTSSLRPSLFAEASGAPERFLAWHFHLTVYRQNLADIMPHPGTDPRCVEELKRYTESIGQNCCVLKKEYPGYLANSMLFVVLDKALDLYLAGAADIADIDKAWMTVRLENSGPFGIIDKIGLDVTAELLPDSPNKEEKLRLLRTMIEEGKGGVKTGSGFYSYPDPIYQAEDFVIRPGTLR